MTLLDILDLAVRAWLALVILAIPIGAWALHRPTGETSLCTDDPARLGLLDRLDGIGDDRGQR